MLSLFALSSLQLDDCSLDYTENSELKGSRFRDRKFYNFLMFCLNIRFIFQWHLPLVLPVNRSFLKPSRIKQLDMLTQVNL